MNKFYFLHYFIAFIFSITSIQISAQTNCGVDTVGYTYQKTTTFRPISLNTASSGNAFAQWFPAPQDISISGFDFYGWQSAGNSSVVTLTCNIYRAGTDSLPSGFPLRSETIVVDSTFGNGQVPNLKKTVTFSSPVTVNYPYIITVETNSTTNVSILANDYLATTPNGRKEWLSSVRIGTNYLRSTAVNVGGAAFDADFIFQPHVSYTLKADFSFLLCNNVGNPITFTNKSSPVLFSPFYNFYAFYNIPQFCTIWDYGDTSGTSYSVNGTKVYTKRLNYKVKLKDTLYGWRKGCADTISKTVFASPAPLKLTNNGPVCSGNPLLFTTDSVPGGTYIWNGPNGFKDSSQNPTIPIADTANTGVYTASVRLNNCPSNLSQMVVNVNPTPAIPNAYNSGPKCVGDSVSFRILGAIGSLNYTWQGPKGFTGNNTSFDFTNLDTSYAGNYYVYAESAFCKSGTDTTAFYIYPPPIPPVLSAPKGNAVCAGDTLYLVGTALPGVNFSWEGPDNFNSSATNPIIPNTNSNKAGKYKARVVIGSCTSQPDSITIDINPTPTASITLAGNASFCNGDSAKINANSGTGLNYTWFNNDTIIPGTTGAFYTAKNTGTYRVLVTNSFLCNDTSGSVSIFTKPLPTITTQPVNNGVNSGRDVQFSVTSPDGAALYKWQEDAGTGFVDLNNQPPYSGVFSNTLIITNTTPQYNNRKYRCILDLGGCETVSNQGVLTIFIGINQVVANGEISIYPNPATNYLNLDIELNTNSQLWWQIVDVTGKTMLVSNPIETTGQYTKNIPLETISPGMYFLQVKTGTEYTVFKFVKE